MSRRPPHHQWRWQSQRELSLDGLFLLSEPQSVQRDGGDLDNLESDSWKITDGMAWTTETSDEDLVVLVDEWHTTIAGHEASDSLVVLLELHSDTLSDGRVGLLGLNGDLLDDDAGGVGCTLEGLSPLGVLIGFVVIVISPSIKSQINIAEKVRAKLWLPFLTCWVSCESWAYDLRWFL